MVDDIVIFGNILNVSLKFIGVFGSIVYLIYTVVLIRQIRIMKETVMVKDGGLFLLLGYVQIVLAILLILYSFFL